MTRMTVRAAVQGALHHLLLRLAEAAPVAWRQDKLFRGAAIGAGVTFALVLFRLAGPHNPALDAPGRTIRAVPGSSMPTLSSAPPPPEMPKIAPGHPLDAATAIVTPVPDSDRFGTFTSGQHK
jgi:hypothetical protein